MYRTGAFGYPLEYCNPGNWTVWSARARQAGQQSVLDFIKSVRTGPNGVFAIKLHHEHLNHFLRHEPAPLSYRFVHLRRRDQLGQALSFARAQQTGVWISDMPETAPASYDWNLISAKLDILARGNARWTAFLAGQGVDPLDLWYEDVAADPQAAIREVARHLGIDLPESEINEEAFMPRPQKAASGAKENWRARFISDSQVRLEDGKAVAGADRRSGAVLRFRDARRGLKSRARAILPFR